MQRNRLVLAAPWLIDAGVIIGALVSRTPLVLVGLIHGTILGLVLTAYAYQRNPFPKLLEGDITADAAGVWFGSELVFPRARLGGPWDEYAYRNWRRRIFAECRR